MAVVAGPDATVPSLGQAFDRPIPPPIEMPPVEEPLAPVAGPDVDGDVVLPAAAPPGGEPDLFTGGARAPQADKSTLVAEALQPGEEAWVNLRDAIDTGRLPRSEVQDVLSEILRALAKGPETMSQVKTSETVLAKFIRDGAGDTVKIDVNFRGPFGETALMQAAVNGRIKHVEDLIKAKADVNAQNAGGETALMWAAAYDEVDVIKVLLKNKASPKLKDELGWTALMVAAWAGNSKAVEALKSSSDKSATNADGLRAEQLAAVDVSPAKTRGTQKAVRSALGIKKGGRHKTQRRKKTNSKKRGTR